MSIDFSAILDHRLSSEQLLLLPKHLQSLPLDYFVDAIVNLWPDSSQEWLQRLAQEQWRWSVLPEESLVKLLSQGNLVRLMGPYGVSINFGPAACECTNSVLHRFIWFLNEPLIQDALRRFWRDISSRLGSSRAIYLPDSSEPVSVASDYIYEGWTVEQISVWLQQYHGPSSSTIKAIYCENENRSYQVNGYFIDTFEQ